MFNFSLNASSYIHVIDSSEKKKKNIYPNTMDDPWMSHSER